MKILTISLTALLLPMLAHATAFSCRDTSAGPDHGYEVQISKNETSAKVSEQTIAGPRSLAMLRCSRIGHNNPKAADFAARLFLRCWEPRLRDAGYSLNLSSSKIGGFTSGRLYAISFAGSKLVANLICKAR